MDISGFEPEHYHLGKLFSMPTSSGGKNAIAVKKSQEAIILAAYTILVGGAFMAWWILIANLLPVVMPRKLRNNQMIMLVASWQVTEPMQSAFIVMRHCTKLISRRKSRFLPVLNASPELSKEGITADMQKPVSGMDICVGILVVVLSLGTVAGGILAGIFLPETMVIGNVAPVNEMMVFQYPSSLYGENYQAGADRTGPLRALSMVDSGSITSKLEEKVSVKKVAATTGGTDYDIKYDFKIHGYEFGLVDLRDLAVHVNGRCSFRPEWYVDHEEDPKQFTDDIVYTFYKGEAEFEDTFRLNLEMGKHAPGEKMRYWQFETVNFRDNYADTDLLRLHPQGERRNKTWSAMRYSIVPGTQRRAIASDNTNTRSRNTDPWYSAGEEPYSGLIKLEIPPLDCNETMNWYYQGTFLRESLSYFPAEIENPTDSDRVQAETPEVHIPDPIYKILTWRFNKPLVVGMMWGIKQGLLESSMRSSFSHGDMRNSSAYMDMRRLIFAGYLLGRNIFREAALTYTNSMLGEEERSQNSLRGKDDKPLAGTGDFIVPSEDISTLRLETVIAVPAVVAFSWVLVFVILALRLHDRASYREVVMESLGLS